METALQTLQTLAMPLRTTGETPATSHAKGTAQGVLIGAAAESEAAVAAALAENGALRSRLERMAAIAELTAQLESAPSLDVACRRLADLLQRRLRADRAFVGLCRADSPRCRLAATAGSNSFHPGDERSLVLQGVLQEATARGERCTWPPADPASGAGLLTHRQFLAANNGLEAVVSSPLRDSAGRVQAAWGAAGARQAVLSDEALSFLEAANEPVASALHRLAKSEATWLGRAFRSSFGWVRKRGLSAAVALALAGAVLAIPLPYSPQCECVVEPVQRRFVAAPFDGPLEKTFVRPGDEIAAGDLLARMDGREIRWELAGAQADLQRAATERAGRLAMHESGQAEAARHEVDRLKMQAELLEHRQQELDIRSPIAGIVVGGDLEDAEGMPLKTGQSLFEIAPLDAMTVEVAIPECDFACVRPGMPATLRLEAFPLRAFEATIDRVHPRSELRDNENAFIATIRIENADGSLRPGMKGTAWIKTDRSPLGWNLLKRPLTAAIAWLGW